MEEEDWAWVCTCGAVIPRGPEGRERETAQAHAAEHRVEIPEAGGQKFGPVPTTLVPPSEFPSPSVCRVEWTNRRTGEVAPQGMVIVANPAYEAFIWHGGTTYQIVPQHPDEPVPPGVRIDRIIQDVDEAMVLIQRCLPPVPDEDDPEQIRQRLVRAVNLFCSAERDIMMLRDELFMSHAVWDAEVLRQRQYLPFQAQPMFRWGGSEGRYFNGRSYAGQERAFHGPLTIQELLAQYAEGLNEAARHVAMAVLAEDGARLDASGEETEYQQHLFAATMFTDEPEAEHVRTVRSIIAPEAESQTP